MTQLRSKEKQVNMANRRQYKHRRKWTDQMNDDLLNCKREAVAITQMEQPPLAGNGKKKEYIKLMKAYGMRKDIMILASRARICVMKLQGQRNHWSNRARKTYHQILLLLTRAMYPS